MSAAAPAPRAAPRPAAPILQARGLRKVYAVRNGPALVAVDDVSFSIERGKSLAIVGESGSGKTTVAKILTGLETADRGSVLLDGADRSQPARTARARRARGRDLQIVFQDPYTSLDRRQSVADCWAEVLRLHLRASPQQSRRRVRELADMVGLDDRQLQARPGALSGGQRQRVAIARALAAQPQVVVLDESLAALDVSIQAQVINLLADVRQATDVTFLLISHDLAVVRQLADDVLVMRGGVVVESGPTSQVLDSPAHPYTQLLLASVPRPGWKPDARTTTPTAAATGRLVPTAKEHP